MTITPQDQTFAEAAEEYRRLWADEGSTIVEAMERGTGLTFLERHVKAVIFEGPSRSGVGDPPMYLRASYPADVKKATLVHEHGHRLIAQLRNRPSDLDEHRVLFLFLYDVWESLWGKDFADQQVEIESGRIGLYDYETAWRWALSISRDAAGFTLCGHREGQSQVDASHARYRRPLHYIPAPAADTIVSASLTCMRGIPQIRAFARNQTSPPFCSHRRRTAERQHTSIGRAGRRKT